MDEIAKINFFKITKSGFFKPNSSKYMFGDTAATLDDLDDWVGDKTLSETATFEIDPDSGANYLNTYCLDIIKSSNSGDFLITTWNESPFTDAGVASIDLNSQVGNVDVEMLELDDGRVPGYATYFWIIPDQDLYATIRFNHLLNGNQAFQAYIQEYLSKFSKYVVVREVEDDDQEADINVCAYQEDDGSEPQQLVAHFKAMVLKKAGKIEFIEENRERISKVLRKSTLSPLIQDSRSLYEKLLTNVGLLDPVPLSTEIKTQFELNLTPSSEELQTIINEWEENNDTKWNDVGFKLSGDNTKHWLSHSLVKHEMTLDVTRDNPEVINGESLLRQLSENRDVLLGLVVE